MPADRGPLALAVLLAEIEAGTLSDATRSTLRRALVAAASGRPVAAILAAGARDRRDAALLALRAEHFADLAPSAAAKAMATALRRHRAQGEPPPAGTLRRACFDVLSAGGGSPSWRTILRALSRSPRAVTTQAVGQASMDEAAC